MESQPGGGWLRGGFWLRDDVKCLRQYEKCFTLQEQEADEMMIGEEQITKPEKELIKNGLPGACTALSNPKISFQLFSLPSLSSGHWESLERQ